MYLQTMLELSHMTDHVKFEWMMCDLLSSHKYKGLDPQSPGMRDNGKDALYHDAEKSIVFAFSIEKDWKGKFERDFKSAKQHNLTFNTFIFCSNQLIPATERDKKIAEQAAQGITVEFYDAGRIKVLLDTHYKRIRQIYLCIQDNTTIRRKITNTLFDAENEVEMPGRWTMFAIAAPADMIGIFTLTKDEDLTLICETEEELTAFNTLLNTLMHYRKLATVIDNYIFNDITDKHLINCHFFDITARLYHKSCPCLAQIRALRRFLRKISRSLYGMTSYLIYSTLFRSDETTNFYLLKWRMSLRNRSWSNMIFCYHKMAQG